MQLAEAVKQLQACGLSRHEALTFLSLARLGAATAREVSRAAGVNRVQIYRALESLEGRGLVEVTLDRPKRYAARALREAFDALIEERKSELSAMEQIRDALLTAWPSIAKREGDTVRLQILKGRRQIYSALRRSVLAAESEVLSFTTSKGILRSYREGINEALLAAMQRGTKARLIADIREDNAALFEKVARYVPLRHLDDQRGRFIVVDGASVLVFLIQDEKGLKGEAETALWTNSPDFVRSHAEIFERAWRMGKRATVRLKALRGGRSLEGE